jgi:beta-phosphoglucomutase-like phosphatase (HAD superfamily)
MSFAQIPIYINKQPSEAVWPLITRPNCYFLNMEEIAMPVSFKALIFDMDGTLFDTEPLHRNAWREAFAPFNMTFEDEDFIPYNGSSPVNVACALIASRKLNADPVAIATRKKSAVERMLRDDPVAFLPAATLLERYHADFRIGLGTGSGASTASTLLGRFSFLKHFQQ